MLRKLEKATFPLLSKLARWLAYFGGFVLTAIAVMTVISIIGRAFVGFGLGPIKGDFELVEIGSAIAVFSFLPWCQLNQGHVTVDIFSNRFPVVVQRFLKLLGNIVITLIAFVLTWRIWMGMGERVTWFEQSTRDVLGFGYKPFSPPETFILGVPVWYGYVLGVVGTMLFSIVAVFTVVRSINELSSYEVSDVRA